MIYITNIRNSVDFHKNLKKENYNAMIRIKDPSCENFPKLQDKTYYNAILELSFDDVEEVSLTSFSKEHLLLLNDFFQQIKDNDDLVIHCHAGVSRSSAIAMGYCMFKENYEGIKQICNNNNYFPNKLIVEEFIKFYDFNRCFVEKFMILNRSLTKDFSF